MEDGNSHDDVFAADRHRCNQKMQSQYVRARARFREIDKWCPDELLRLVVVVEIGRGRRLRGRAFDRYRCLFCSIADLHAIDYRLGGEGGILGGMVDREGIMVGRGPFGDGWRFFFSRSSGCCSSLIQACDSRVDSKLALLARLPCTCSLRCLTASTADRAFF